MRYLNSGAHWFFMRRCKHQGHTETDPLCRLDSRRWEVRDGPGVESATNDMSNHGGWMSCPEIILMLDPLMQQSSKSPDSCRIQQRRQEIFPFRRMQTLVFQGFWPTRAPLMADGMGKGNLNLSCMMHCGGHLALQKTWDVTATYPSPWKETRGRFCGWLMNIG